MSTPSEQFSLGEITEALEEVLTDPLKQEMVVQALHAKAVERQERQRSDLRLDSLVRLGRGLIRIEGSDSNIEGWYEELDAESVRFLDLIDEHGVKDSLTDLEQAGRDTAALLYTYAAMRPVGSRIEPERLEKAGVNSQELLTKYRLALLDVYPNTAENVTVLTNTLNSLEGLYRINSHPQVWEKLISPQKEKLLELLREKGVTLPKLNKDRKFAEEDD